MRNEKEVVEVHIKIKHEINEEALFKLGCERIGVVHEEDSYYIPKEKSLGENTELIRVRKIGEERSIETKKIHEEAGISKSTKGKFLLRDVKTENKVSEKDLKKILKNYKLIVKIYKLRKIFLLENIIINIDYVESLGKFIEIKGKRKDIGKINWIIEELGLDLSEAVALTYFQLMLLKLSPIQRLFYSIYEKLAKYSFGLVSGTVTVMGMIMGTAIATASRLIVILSILLVAIGEALGDSLGGFMEKKVERMTSFKEALFRAKNLGLGIFFTEASFSIWFLILPINLALITSIIYGILLIIFVSIEESFIKNQKLFRILLINLGLFFLTLGISYLVGSLLKV